MDLKTVLVVCNGNIHRSVIAEFCLNKALEEMNLSKRLIAISRGLQGTLGTALPRGRNLCDYPLEWSLSSPVLDEIGIDISSHCVTLIDISVVEKASLILAMDRAVLVGKSNSLFRQFSKYSYKMRLFRELEGRPEDVPDCFGSSDATLHRHVIRLSDRRLNCLYRTL